MTTQTAAAILRLTALNLALALSLGACGAADEGEEIPVEDADATVNGKADGARVARFETFAGQDGRSYFHLLAANGQKVLQSQGYATVRDAEAGIASVRAYAPAAESYEVLQAVDGQWYFNLVAVNGQVVATSELYTQKNHLDRALATAAGLAQVAAELPASVGARFELFRGLDGQYYFHLRAKNGEIVLVSQGYTRKSSAEAGIASVRANGVDAARYQVSDAADGQAYFVLRATNGQVIGVSETYASRASAALGATAVTDLLAGAASSQSAAE